MDREAKSVSSIDWMSPAYVIDSTIKTWGTRDTYFNRSGFNFNGRHSFNSDEELSADIDVIQFRINGGQSFQTQVSTPGSPIQATKGNVPATLEIFTAKLDYSKRFRNFLWEAGFKTATTNTDNLTEYFFNDGNTWYDDLGRSNHFLYDENINAVYSSIDMKDGKWHWQAGLRYEHTGYKANQLGNAAVKDSSFTRNYASIFPSAFV